MSWRRGHTRTNRFGTTFNVRGHGFDRGQIETNSYRLTRSGGEIYVNGSLTFNINCPGCGDPVFFYQNGHGSRVFFNKLGKPWPKHNCPNWEPRFETAPIAVRSWVLDGDAQASHPNLVINVRELFRRGGMTRKQREAQKLYEKQMATLKKVQAKEASRQADLEKRRAEWKASGSPMPKNKRVTKDVEIIVKKKRSLRIDLKDEDS